MLTNERDLKIFASCVEEKALAQIEQLMEQPAFAKSKVRIMPDVHAGAGCVIGFTADLGDKVIPNVVGVDIGCGMLTVQVKGDMDFAKLDAVIREKIPSGMNAHDKVRHCFFELEDLRCREHLRGGDYFERSIGTLGGGNHFIEVDVDDDGNQYLVIHSGSRNLGKQVADYYQRLAIEREYGNGEEYANRRSQIICELKEQGRENEIAAALAAHAETHPGRTRENGLVPKQLCYLTGQDRLDYLHDMQICQRYASRNRRIMEGIIVKAMGWTCVDSFETVHNYIDMGSNIVRKGAVSARAGELLLIPMNMRDGSLICRGKGNDDWNQSAPHGAGRLMGRKEAKGRLNVDDFKRSMDGVYTTSVGIDTLDEAPDAYKPMDAIVPLISDTVEILKVIRPVYNFKASE